MNTPSELNLDYDRVAVDGPRDMKLVYLPPEGPKSVSVCLAKESRESLLRYGTLSVTLKWQDVNKDYPIDWEEKMFEFLMEQAGLS